MTTLGKHREPVGEIRVTRTDRHPLALDAGLGRQIVRISDDEYSMTMPGEQFDAIELPVATVFSVHKANAYDREAGSDDR